MIKTSVILFVIFYLTSANAAQTVDKLNSNQLILLKETASKALILNSNKQIKSSSTSDVELGYLSGASSNVQDQIDGKANDADAVHLTGDESIAGVKTLTGKLVASSTVNASIPCPVMTQTQRDAIATPSVGDCVFNSDTSLSNIYDGAIWKAMGGSGGGIGLWVTANGYAVDDVVIESNNIYICLTAHTSGTFATDLAAVKWAEVSPYVDTIGVNLKSQNGASSLVQEIQVPNNQSTNTATDKFLLETGNKNILSNQSWEHLTFSTGWTNSAGTFTQELTSVIDGKASAKLVLSSQTMSLTQSSTLYAAQFADGVQGIATVRLKSNVALKVCSIQAGTVSTSNCVDVPSDNKWGLFKVPFILGATSNGISIASTGAVSGTVYIDDAFVGVTDIAQISSAIGPWTSYTPTFTGFGTVTTIYMKWRQNGPDIEIRGVFTVGTPTATEARISLPNSYTSSTTPALSLAGDMGRTTNASTTYFRHGILAEPSVGYVTIGHQVSAQGLMVKRNGDVAAVTGETFSVNFSVPVTQFSGSASTYSTPSDSFSTDSNTLTHKTTAIVASDAIGTYNTFSYAINTNTKTICGTAPSALPSSANGFLIFTRAFNAASNCGNPARIEIKIGAAGDKFPTIKTDIYKSVGKVTIGELDYLTIGTLSQRGMAIKSYSEENGVLVMDAGLNAAVTYTSNDFQFSDATAQTSGFLVINAQKAKDFVVGQFNGLQSCTDTLACTDTFSAKISAAGVVSDENVNWINGNFTVSPVGTFSASFNTSVFTVSANCVATPSLDPGSSVSSTVSSISSSAIVVTTDNTAGAASLQFTLVCQKQGADYIGKTAMAVASDQNLRTPGVTKGVVYSAFISDTGVVSNEIGDIINGSCTKSGTSNQRSTCSFVSSSFSSTPICQCTTTNAGALGSTILNCVVDNSATNSTTLVYDTSANNIASSRNVNVTCHGVSP